MDPHDRVIWSADVDYQQLVDRLDEMPGLTQVKLDRLFLDQHGKGCIDNLSGAGYRVFADAKLVEIPTKLERLAEVYCRHHPWMLNCMAGSLSNGVNDGPTEKQDGLKRFAAVCHDAGVRPCGVTVLTTKTPEVIYQEFGRTPPEAVLFYVDRLIQAEFSDVVCSPEEAEAIREAFGDAIQINTPGVRLATVDDDDQERVMTPSKALEAGATRLVIGRPITHGGAEGLGRIVADIEGARLWTA